MSDIETKLDDYSRGRADAEVEYNETLSTIKGFIETLQNDIIEIRDQYRGNQEISNKLMNAYYGGKLSSLNEVLACLEFLGIGIKEKAEG